MSRVCLTRSSMDNIAFYNSLFCCSQVTDWKVRSETCLVAKPAWSFTEVEKLVKEGEEISGGLPNLAKLKDSVSKAKDWLEKANTAANGENFPFLDTLEQLVAKGRPLPIKLEQLSTLEQQVASSR